MDPGRADKLPFKNGTPGRKFLQSFQKRHMYELIFARPARQDAIRYAACNGDTLTTNVAVLEKLTNDNKIDAKRVWNWDQSGATSGKDVIEISACKRLMGRKGMKDMILAQFLNVHRVTMMPVISAAGDGSPSLFVFKGKRIPYRWFYVMEGRLSRQLLTFCLDTLFFPLGSKMVL